MGQIPAGPALQSKNAPSIFVIYMDVMYAGFAGAKNRSHGGFLFNQVSAKL